MVIGQTQAETALAPCNTQAQTAKLGGEADEQKHDLTKEGVEVLIDYVGITYMEHVEVVTARYGGEGWTPLAHGWKGYKRGIQRGNVKIWFDGKPEQGVSVQFAGKGCRELEARGIVKDWVSWLSEHVVLGRFSRLDVAMDDRAVKPENGLLQKEAIEASIQQCRIVSRYKYVDDRRRRSLHDATEKGWTRYFGSTMSETFIRMYDKVMEQEITESYHWMRCELETRREKSHELARLIVEHGLAGVASVIRGLLDFKEGDRPEQTGGRNYREWETVAWWSAFLGEVGKLRLTLAPVIRTMEDVKAWFLKSIAPLAAVVFDHERRAVGGSRFLREMIEDGRKRRKHSHRMLLACA